MPDATFPEPTPTEADRRRERWIAVLATVVACVPIATAALRAAAGRWVPIGDDAYFTVRSMDVATSHHPLVGAWSSGSTDLDRHVNNLGPLQLDLMAPFTKIAPMGGTAIAVGTVHIAAIVTIAWLIARLGGRLAVVPAMVAVSGMTWLMGSEMLVSARQHQFLLPTFLLVLVAAWSATAGDRWALVPLVAAGSLVTQTHLSYPILVAVVAIPALDGQLVAARRYGARAHYRRPWIVATVLAVVLWSQTFIDQFVGWGNLGAVLSSPGDEPAVGPTDGLRVVADVVVAARGYVRPGFANYDPNLGLAGPLRVSAYVALVAVAATIATMAWRRRHRTASAGAAVAAAGLVAAVVDAATLPIGRFGITAANHRWLWPVAWFGVMGVLVAVHHVVTAARPNLLRPVTAAFGAALVALALANVPESYQVPRPDVFREQIRVTAELTDQLDALELEGPVAIDQSHLYFGHPFAYPMAAVLSDRGIDFRFDGEMQARRFGESRVADGTEPTRLVLYHSDEARALASSPEAVISIDGVDPLVVVAERQGTEVSDR